MGRIKSSRATINRRDHERLSHVEDHKSPSFCAVWETFVTYIREAFLLDSRAVSAPALRCLERALKAAATAAVPSDAAALRSSLVEIWEKTWVKCEEMGAVVVRRASVVAQHVHGPAPFTQESLVVFVDVIKCGLSVGCWMVPNGRCSVSLLL